MNSEYRVPYNRPALIEFDYLVSGIGQTGDIPSYSILRISDGKIWDFNDDTWQATPVDADDSMVEQNSTYIPGIYKAEPNFNWTDSKGYIVRVFKGVTPDWEAYISVIVDDQYPAAAQYNLKQIMAVLRKKFVGKIK